MTCTWICDQISPGQSEPISRAPQRTHWAGGVAVFSPGPLLWYVLLPAEVGGNEASVCSVSEQGQGPGRCDPAKVNTRRASSDTPSPNTHTPPPPSLTESLSSRTELTLICAHTRHRLRLIDHRGCEGTIHTPNDTDCKARVWNSTQVVETRTADAEKHHPACVRENAQLHD